MHVWRRDKGKFLGKSLCFSFISNLPFIWIGCKASEKAKWRTWWVLVCVAVWWSQLGGSGRYFAANNGGGWGEGAGSIHTNSMSWRRSISINSTILTVLVCQWQVYCKWTNNEMSQGCHRQLKNKQNTMAFNLKEDSSGQQAYWLLLARFKVQ